MKNTMANEIAEIQGDESNLVWIDGENDFATFLGEIAEERYDDGYETRFEFADGSAIIVGAGGWRLGLTLLDLERLGAGVFADADLYEIEVDYLDEPLRVDANARARFDRVFVQWCDVDSE